MRTSSGPNHAQAGARVDNANNLFASGEIGLWAYIQTLEEKVKQLTDKVVSMEGQIATMERTETAQEQQIVFLTGEVTALRHQVEKQPGDGDEEQRR